MSSAPHQPRTVRQINHPHRPHRPLRPVAEIGIGHFFEYASGERGAGEGEQHAGHDQRERQPGNRIAACAYGTNAAEVNDLDEVAERL